MQYLVLILLLFTYSSAFGNDSKGDVPLPPSKLQLTSDVVKPEESKKEQPKVQKVAPVKKSVMPAKNASKNPVKKAKSKSANKAKKKSVAKTAKKEKSEDKNSPKIEISDDKQDDFVVDTADMDSYMEDMDASSDKDVWGSFQKPVVKASSKGKIRKKDQKDVIVKKSKYKTIVEYKEVEPVKLPDDNMKIEVRASRGSSKKRSKGIFSTKKNQRPKMTVKLQRKSSSTVKKQKRAKNIKKKKKKKVYKAKSRRPSAKKPTNRVKKSSKNKKTKKANTKRNKSKKYRRYANK